MEWMCSPYAEESGVRTFTGSRSASVDATFSDHADDCTDNGFPRPQVASEKGNRDKRGGDD